MKDSFCSNFIFIEKMKKSEEFPFQRGNFHFRQCKKKYCGILLTSWTMGEALGPLVRPILDHGRVGQDRPAGPASPSQSLAFPFWEMWTKVVPVTSLLQPEAALWRVGLLHQGWRREKNEQKGRADPAG